MKTLKYITLSLAALTLSLTTTSCKKDKEDPTITVNTPAQHTTYNWGQEVHVDATFADDKGLKSYVVTVVDADGNHIHAFNFMETGETKEASYGFHEHFVVPTDAPEMAWVQFTVTDGEDKTAVVEWMLHFEE